MSMSKGKKIKSPESYKVRRYRQSSQAANLVEVHVCVKETDLHIQADRDVQRRAEELVFESRLQIEEYIINYPEFYSSLQPISKDFTATPLIKEMFDAARKADVGPMAAVAGAIAEYVGKKLLKEGVEEIIVENGGDIFISRKQQSRIAIFAGESPLSNRIGIEFPAVRSLGICTSSGTIGHSLSLGEADSVTVIAASTALADAVATRLGNEVGGEKSSGANVNKALKIARGIDEVIGVVIVCGETMGAVGDVKIVKLDE